LKGEALQRQEKKVQGKRGNGRQEKKTYQTHSGAKRGLTPDDELKGGLFRKSNKDEGTTGDHSIFGGGKSSHRKKIPAFNRLEFPPQTFTGKKGGSHLLALTPPRPSFKNSTAGEKSLYWGMGGE